MKPYPIVKNDRSMEIVCKIADSIARDYGSRILYDEKHNRPVYFGKEEYKRHIREDFASLMKRA